MAHPLLEQHFPLPKSCTSLTSPPPCPPRYLHTQTMHHIQLAQDALWDPGDRAMWSALRTRIRSLLTDWLKTATVVDEPNLDPTLSPREAASATLDHDTAQLGNSPQQDSTPQVIKSSNETALNTDHQPTALPQACQLSGINVAATLENSPALSADTSAEWTEDDSFFLDDALDIIANAEISDFKSEQSDAPLFGADEVWDSDVDDEQLQRAIDEAEATATLKRAANMQRPIPDQQKEKQPQGSVCLICFDDCADDALVQCDAGHAVCKDCFSQHVLQQCDISNGLEDMLSRGGQVACINGPQGCASECFDDYTVAQLCSKDVFRQFMKSRSNMLEFKVRKEVFMCCLHHLTGHQSHHQAELEAAIERKRAEARAKHETHNMEARIVGLRKEVIEDVLADKCPRCKHVFIDFTGCFAIVCNCGAYFCAWCLQMCRDSAYCHAHVLACEHNLDRAGGYFSTEERFRRARALRYERNLGALLRGKDEAVVDALLTSLRQELKDLRVDPVRVKKLRNPSVPNVTAPIAPQQRPAATAAVPPPRPHVPPPPRRPEPDWMAAGMAAGGMGYAPQPAYRFFGGVGFNQGAALFHPPQFRQVREVPTQNRNCC